MRLVLTFLLGVLSIHFLNIITALVKLFIKMLNANMCAAYFIHKDSKLPPLLLKANVPKVCNLKWKLRNIILSMNNNAAISKCSAWKILGIFFGNWIKITNNFFSQESQSKIILNFFILGAFEIDHHGTVMRVDTKVGG